MALLNIFSGVSIDIPIWQRLLRHPATPFRSHSMLPSARQTRIYTVGPALLAATAGRASRTHAPHRNMKEALPQELPFLVHNQSLENTMTWHGGLERVISGPLDSVFGT